MAITETILGPNSSALVISGSSETPTTMMNAVEAYVTAHGWELHDGNAAGVTSRVFRALQQGSTTVYKYVQITFTTTTYSLVPHESWNATTHVGTNAVTSLNTGSAVSTVTTQVFNCTDGASLIMFVNRKWLATRFRNNILQYGEMIGSFEISKDFGEAATVPSNILLSTAIHTQYPANTPNGFFGTMVNNGTSGTPSTVTTSANIVTAIGMPSSGLALSRMLTGFINNSALTMTAVETAGGSAYGVARFRGRILGSKLIAGNQVWNDMDTAQILVDSEFHQDSTGSAMQHHIIAPSTVYVRFLIPV